MTKLEKVIKGLELCTRDVTDDFIQGCYLCPYKPTDYDEKDCVGRTQKDALELLKAKDINVPIKWVSVKDRLPDSAGYKCLVVAINKFGQKSVFTAFTGYGDFKWYTTDVIYMNKVNRNTVSDAWTITHWMPLPEPPKEDKDNDE